MLVLCLKVCSRSPESKNLLLIEYHNMFYFISNFNPLDEFVAVKGWLRYLYADFRHYKCHMISGENKFMQKTALLDTWALMNKRKF